MKFIYKIILGFSIYFFFLYLKVLSFKPGVKKIITERNICILFRTEDNKNSRYISFNKGKVNSGSTPAVNPDFSLIWKSAKSGIISLYGFATGNKKIIASGITGGKMKIEGDAGSVSWFLVFINKIIP